jgi:hypothetical protein
MNHKRNAPLNLQTIIKNQHLEHETSQTMYNKALDVMPNLKAQQ